MGIAAITMAASMFAANFAARVVMEGKVADGTIAKDKKATTTNFLTLDKKDQKDADALVISTSGDKAGANFQFWYNYAGNDADLKVRSTNLWFKPVDMVKVTVGDVSVGTYKEMLDWWKVGKGEAAADHVAWGWSGFATVEGSGISVEVTPIDGLWLNAGVTADTGSAFATLKKDANTYAAYGVGAKYAIPGMPMSAAITWRDAGKDAEKILSVGAEYGNMWAAGFYGFLNIRARFENIEYATVNADAKPMPLALSWKTDKSVLSAVVFDNFVKYSVGAFQVLGRFPVTVRTTKDLTGDANASDWGRKDPSWMSYEVKCSYALGQFTPYLDIENDNAITFDEGLKESILNMTVKAATTVNVGSAAIDAGLQIAVPNKKGANLGWSVPFNVAVAF